MESSSDDNMEHDEENTENIVNADKTMLLMQMNGGSAAAARIAPVSVQDEQDGDISQANQAPHDGQWTNKPYINPMMAAASNGGGSGVGGVVRPAPNWANNQYNANNNENKESSVPIELWVEAKADGGRSYYYHSMTRQTTWTKPEGPNIAIKTQQELQDGNKRMHIINNASDPTAHEDKSMDAPNALGPDALTSQPPPNMLNQPPPNAVPGVQQPPLLTQPPPNVRHHPPPMFQTGMPPNFGQAPFCMPPPSFGFPAGPAPWSMPPWNQQMHATPPAVQQEKPAKNLIIKPGVIDPAVIARAAEWSEYRAPDGRPYYFHAGRNESVWEKPQALRDMEAARMAAHSGATPQQAMAPTQQPPMAAAGGMPPHLLPNPMMQMAAAAAAAASNPFDPTIAYAHAAAANNVKAAAAAAAAAAENTKANQAVALEKEAKKAAEEKRKKEEEQKKAAASAKPVDKSRPVTSTAIVGTPWCVVWTGDGRVFYYNPSSRTSVWERPEELTDRKDVDKIIREPPEALRANTVVEEEKTTKSETPEVEEKQKTEQIPSNTSVSSEVEAIPDDDDDEVIKIRTESESSVEEVPNKRTRVTAKSKKNDASEAAVEAEQRAAKERALVPLETRVQQFKEMLREKDVSAFSTWEKELHKIVFDPRYLLLTSKERKQVFEKYVRDRAEEERKEKRNKMRQKREDFRKLMEDAKLHGKSSFSDFCQRFGKDDRYRGIEKIRERESLFNEYIVEVRRREKEDKLLKKEQIRKDFLEMLRERGDFDRHTRWYDVKKKFESDSRYRAVESSSYREEYFEAFLRIQKDEKRRQRELKEQRERERKSDRKDKDRRDRQRDRGRDRDRDRSRSRDRGERRSSKEKEKEREKDNKEKKKSEDRKKREVSEEGEHKDEEDDEGESTQQSEGELEREREERESEAERLLKERDRQLRAEQSIREREKEVQRTLAGHLRERDKEREHHKRDEAIGHFNALLADLVRNPDFTWKEVKRQLRKDHRWELIESLDRDDREKIFNEHIESLMKKKREKFREMLDELTTLQLTSSWKEIKKQIKEDPRYLKFNSEHGEREYRDYIKDKTLHAKAELRELLKECKFITHKTIDLIKENSGHIKEIEDILKNDKRYLVLDHLQDERKNIVMSFLEELNKRGPPPPPTASESLRRNK